MKIHRLTGRPDGKLAAALADFEKEFQYPLGPGRSFSISHGADYSLFFRSMGDARIYLAEIAGKIVGALTMVGRTAVLADGSVIPAAYFCDAKVVSSHRGRTVLGRLAITARDDAMAAGFKAAYSVVMSGSIPANTYTGRLGLPHFIELGRLAILRFDTAAGYRPGVGSTGGGKHGFHRFQGGDRAISSSVSPHAVEVDGARGILVDTRIGKRLWQSDGSEMISAHLCELRFDSKAALSSLMAVAVETAESMGFPGLFVALPARSDLLDAVIDSAEMAPTTAEATVFGSGLPAGDWMVNTSEI